MLPIPLSEVEPMVVHVKEVFMGGLKNMDIPRSQHKENAEKKAEIPRSFLPMYTTCQNSVSFNIPSSKPTGCGEKSAPLFCRLT